MSAGWVGFTACLDSELVLVVLLLVGCPRACPCPYGHLFSVLEQSRPCACQCSPGPPLSGVARPFTYFVHAIYSGREDYF
jgi:hypothetical protein